MHPTACREPIIQLWCQIECRNLQFLRNPYGPTPLSHTHSVPLFRPIGGGRATEQRFSIVHFIAPKNEDTVDHSLTSDKESLEAVSDKSFLLCGGVPLHAHKGT